MTDKLLNIAENILRKEPITREEAAFIASDAVDVYDLMFHANRIRREFVGNDVKACAIVSARTGSCSEDCSFCSQSAHFETEVESHSFLPKDQIAHHAKQAMLSGAYSLGVVTSGKGISGEKQVDEICGALSAVRDTGIQAHASLGVVTDDRHIKKMMDAGLTCAHLNLETSKRFYPNICTTHSWEERHETLLAYKRNGLRLCSGGLFGLGETWEDRIDLGFVLRDLDIENMPINFLIPIPGTAMQERELMEPLEALRIISLYRFILPQKGLGVYGGREPVLREMQSLMFMAGANGIMVGNYLTTSGRNVEDDKRMIRDAGLKLTVYS